jgi:hypothetical protein
MDDEIELWIDEEGDLNIVEGDNFICIDRKGIEPLSQFLTEVKEKI